MSETTEGAGPALCPASAASGEQKSTNHEAEALTRLIEQAAEIVRGQPLVSAGILIAAGIFIGKLLSRR